MYTAIKRPLVLKRVFRKSTQFTSSRSLLTTIVHAYLSAYLTLRTAEPGQRGPAAHLPSLPDRTHHVRSVKNIYAERAVPLRPGPRACRTGVLQLRRSQLSIAVMEVTMSEFRDEFGGREPADDTDQFGGQQPAEDTDQFGGREPADDTDQFGGQQPAEDTDQFGGPQPADDTDQFGGQQPAEDTDQF